jgi:hypothetical protein
MFYEADWRFGGTCELRRVKFNLTMWHNARYLCIALLLWSLGCTQTQTPETRKAAPAQHPETPAPPPTPGQEQNPTPPPSRPQFFAGTVTALDATSITVSKLVVGKAPEQRTFAITPKTKVSRSVKVKSRVTVRYQRQADGDVALDVLIHPARKSSKG